MENLKLHTETLPKNKIGKDVKKRLIFKPTSAQVRFGFYFSFVACRLYPSVSRACAVIKQTFCLSPLGAWRGCEWQDHPQALSNWESGSDKFREPWEGAADGSKWKKNTKRTRVVRGGRDWGERSRWKGVPDSQGMVFISRGTERDLPALSWFPLPTCPLPC